MKYQDLKIRDSLRMLGLAALFALGSLILIVCRSSAEPLLNGINVPRAHHDLYWIVFGVLGIMAVVCIGVVVQYLVTSPEQNAKYILKAKAKLPPSLLETANPYYTVPTWKYIVARFSMSTDV